MKIIVTHAGPVVGPNGIVHMNNTFDDVTDWTIRDGQLIINRENEAQEIYNWSHILRLTLDKYSKVRITS